MTAGAYSVSDLIAAFGGPTAFARVIGKGVSTVTEMKRSGSVGVRYWPSIIAVARERGEEMAWITSETLMLMHAPVERTPEAAGATK